MFSVCISRHESRPIFQLHGVKIDKVSQRLMLMYSPICRGPNTDTASNERCQAVNP